MNITVNGKDVNIVSALPLTIGDWRKLAARGLTDEALAAPTSETTFTLVFYVLNKANKDIVEDDVNSLPVKVFAAVAQQINKLAKEAEEKIDIPFLTTSTS